VGDQQALASQLVVQPRGKKGLELLAKSLIDLAIKSAVPGINEAAGIAKGSLYGLPIHRRRRGISILKKDLTASRTRANIARTERIPAAKNWSTRLPVVGSIYM
jgi:hypothetical protein